MKISARNTGILYGIGIGPGDPELITFKGARLIGASRHLFVPKARTAAESVALNIVRNLVGAQTVVHEVVFPMTADQEQLDEKWNGAASEVAEFLEQGEDVCFLTLGDSLLYSTYIYLLKAIKRRLPGVETITIPGITSFCAAAALTNFPIGEGKRPVTIIPTADDLGAVRDALLLGGTVILMKIGKRLDEILSILDEKGLLDQAVFVSHATMADERIETDLRRLRAESPEAGYLSVILVHADKRGVRSQE